MDITKGPNILSKIDRPWLSIIRHMTKHRFTPANVDQSRRQGLNTPIMGGAKYLIQKLNRKICSYKYNFSD